MVYFHLRFLMTQQKSPSPMVTWSPIVISLFALLFAAFTLWSTRLAGPSLKLVPASRVTSTADYRSEGARRPAIIVPVMITNSGARSGYVTDVALEVDGHNARGRKEIFRSLFEQLDDKVNLGTTLTQPEFSPFQAFSVGPGETVVKDVFFILLNQQSDFSLEVGPLSITPLTQTVHKPTTWRTWDELTLNVLQVDRAALDSAQSTPNPDGGRRATRQVGLSESSTTPRGRGLRKAPPKGPPLTWGRPLRGRFGVI